MDFDEKSTLKKKIQQSSRPWRVLIVHPDDHVVIGYLETELIQNCGFSHDNLLNVEQYKRMDPKRDVDLVVIITNQTYEDISEEELTHFKEEWEESKESVKDVTQIRITCKDGDAVLDITNPQNKFDDLIQYLTDCYKTEQGLLCDSSYDFL